MICTAEMIISYSLNLLYVWYADLILAFGLIPDYGIELVSVGWFLETVFVFYMMFLFFVFLMKDRRRAWQVIAICFVFTYPMYCES